MEKFFRLIKLALPLAIVVFCLFEFMLHRQSEIVREFAAAFLSLSWMLLACLAIWCGTFVFLTFSLNDLPLIGLLLIAIAAYFIGNARPGIDAIMLLTSVTLGKGAKFLLKSRKQKAESGNGSSAECGTRSAENKSEFQNPNSELRMFLVGLVGLLAFSSWWHLDMSNNFYHGPRWMGLWNNPNIYGMLMSAGVVLAVGLLAANSKVKIKNSKLGWALGIAAGMMGVGLVCSYSRGSWLGAAVGLLYLAWAYGKFKWRYVLPGVAVVAAVVFFFWHATPDNAPWYVKRMDLGRPSAQHRVDAWRGALQMMRDHPLGVGWNNAVTIYEKNYSPPENGAAAITTNDYLMLGTQLGWPGLICFVSYVGLALKTESRKQKAEISSPDTCHSSLQAACRAGALAMLVAFWFDGGLFTLATAAVFWILLELGAMRGGGKEDGGSKMENGMAKAEMV